MNPIRRLILISILLAAAGVVGLLLYFFRSPGTVARFPDGAKVKLLSVSVGTNSITFEPWWQPMMRRILPVGAQGRIAQPFRSGPHGNTNSISVWVQCSGLLEKPNHAGNQFRVEIINDFGEPAGTHWVSSGIQNLTLLNFPRRQSSFGMRFFNGTNQAFREIRVPNLINGPFPEWKPEMIPVTKTNGDLAVTFKGIKNILEFQRYPAPGRTNIDLVPDFEINWKGTIATQWVLGSCIMEDATGNWLGGVIPGLSNHEPAWRLKPMFHRLTTAPFAPSERVRLEKLSIPTEGTFQVLNIETNLQGITLWILGWAGAGELTLSNGIPISAQAHHTAEPYQQMSAGWTNLAAGWAGAAWMETVNLGKPTLLIAHTDGGLSLKISSVFVGPRDERKEARLNSRHFGSPDPNGKRATAIHIFVQPDLTQTLSAEIIVQRLREFEFYTPPGTKDEWIGRPPP